MSLFSWSIPKNTPQIYYLNAQFTSLFCRKLEFDAATTKYKMTFYEYIELVQELRIRGSPHLFYAKLSKVIRLIFLLLLALNCSWVIYTGSTTSNSTAPDAQNSLLMYFYLAGVYILALFALKWFQMSQEKQAVKKMRVYLTSANPLMFNNKQLHWEIQGTAGYLILHLDYNGTKPGVLGMSSFGSSGNNVGIEMYFHKNSSSAHIPGLDQPSPDSIRQSIMSSYKYAY